MTVRDFIRKEYRIARERGVSTALREGTAEATLKALGPLADVSSSPIWATDWDVCLVLDGCRYDVFTELVDDLESPIDPYLEGATTEDALSVGSASPEWISKTFGDEHREHWRRAGYVTANPFSGKDGDELAALDRDVVPLEDRGLAYLDEVWRDQWGEYGGIETVVPSTVGERGRWAWNKRAELDLDRLVVHYMQPHVPFRSASEWSDGWGGADKFGTDGDGKDDWHKLRDGELDRLEFWEAYRDNLAWVLEDVARWLARTDATVLITSDHGNAMGEFAQWGHPPGSANPYIRRVPWVVVESSVVSTPVPVPTPVGDPPVVGEPDELEAGEEAEERLAALGYTGGSA